MHNQIHVFITILFIKHAENFYREKVDHPKNIDTKRRKTLFEILTFRVPLKMCPPTLGTKQHSR